MKSTHTRYFRIIKHLTHILNNPKIKDEDDELPVEIEAQVPEMKNEKKCPVEVEWLVFLTYFEIIGGASILLIFIISTLCFSYLKMKKERRRSTNTPITLYTNSS